MIVVVALVNNQEECLVNNQEECLMTVHRSCDGELSECLSA